MASISVMFKGNQGTPGSWIWGKEGVASALIESWLWLIESDKG